MPEPKAIRFDILTLFPGILDSYFSESILKRAQERKIVTVKTRNVRDYATDKHRTVDDTPYGGGAGMVMMAEPILRAVRAIERRTRNIERRTAAKVIVLSAKGKQFTQKTAYDWARRYDHLVLVSGRYEGIDERVGVILKAEEISIGPYVTTDGDVAAMVVVSAVARLIPGVIRLESLAEESHWHQQLQEERRSAITSPRTHSAQRTAHGSLEYPHYTRPEVITWRGRRYRVPKVLLSGDHKKIEAWRARQRKAVRH